MIGITVQLTQQIAGQQPALNFQQAPIADFITEQRMGDFLTQTALESGNKALAPFGIERHPGADANKIAGP